MVEIPGYTIVRELGQGGMAIVYLAVQKSLGREVAIKMLTPAMLQYADAPQRFLREARVAAQLHHRHIVAIHDVGEVGGVPYMAMEHLPGGSAAALAQQDNDPAAVLRVLRDIAGALDYAHGTGVIHRDIKPENILRHRDGSWVLCDFGIARTADTRTVLTEQGATMGTPHYMSPEQLRGETLDGRADLYSLGVSLHQMLTGQLPYTGTDGWAIGMQHLSAPVPRLPAASAHLQPLLDAMMAKERDQRPQTGAEVVRLVDDILAGKTPTPATAPMAHLPKPAAPPGKRRTGLIAAVGVAAIAVGAIAWWQPWRRAAVAPAPQAQVANASIAVLPFANLSSDKDQEYFSDGLADQLINALAQIDGLRVAGRTSAFSFKGKGEDLRTIAQRLEVATVLEGSVQKAGNRIRITAKLIDPGHDTNIWSQSFDKTTDDLFAVQDEITHAVVDALKVKLLPGKQPVLVHPANADAYDQYLVGRDQSERATPEGFRLAQAAYRKAIELDPNYAPAYAGLAIAASYVADTGSNAAEIADAKQAAIAAADKAVALAPNIADGYSARGSLRFRQTWDWPGAEKDYQRALELNPGDSTTQRRYANLLAALGKMPEAIESGVRATTLDPLSATGWSNLGYYYNSAGRYPDAKRVLERALQIKPNNAVARFHLGVNALLQAQAKDALATFEQAPEGIWRSLGTTAAQFDAGDRKASDETLAKLEAEHALGSAYQIAEAYAWRGDTDKAFDWLGRAYDQRDGGLSQIQYDPLLRKVRGDPRYAELVKKLGFP